MIPKNQSVPDVAQDTLPVVYAAAKVTGGCIYRPNRGQNPYPWGSPGALAAIDDVAQARADQNEKQISRTLKQKQRYAQPCRIQRETEDGADPRDEHDYDESDENLTKITNRGFFHLVSQTASRLALWIRIRVGRTSSASLQAACITERFAFQKI